MRLSVLRRVRPLADAQLGVLTSAQLRQLGVDLELPRREGWLRLADGVWLVHDAPEDEQLLVALELYAPGAVASGPLACRWLGLRHAPRAPGLHALVEHGRTLRGGPLLQVRQTRRLPEAVEHAGRPVAPAARAVADAARWCGLQDARAVVLAALADRAVARAALQAELQAGARRTAGRLLRSLEDWDRGARSAPEAEAADALLGLGGTALPQFLLNPKVRLDGRLVGCPDGWLLDAGLGWEMDSVEFHGEAESLEATFARHQRFTDAGLELLHATPTRMRADRRAWARDVVGRAARRTGDGWSPPTGLQVVPTGPLLGGTSAVAA